MMSHLWAPRLSIRAVALACSALIVAGAPATLWAQAGERAAVGSGVAPGTESNSPTRPLQFVARPAAGGVIVLPASSAADAATRARALDPSLGALVERVAAIAKFTGKAETTLSLPAAGSYERLLIVGVGDAPLSAAALADFGGKAAQETRSDAAAVTIMSDGLNTTVPAAAAHVALGAGLGQYRFDRYKTDGRTPPPVQPIAIVSADAQAGPLFAREMTGLIDAVTLARDLAAEPSNVKHPESFVASVQAAFRGVPNVSIEVLNEAQMRALNMGSLLSVAQGSRRPGRLMVVRYSGAGDAAPLALVGKGITFDSGGISLKPGLGMWEMKSDMSGAAAAVAGVLAVARRGARANVIGVAALAENMPGDNAQRPGDVVRTMNGRTIEVLNTDAEGRLVLVDANQYVIDRYRPAALVNIATLTGAITIALGDEYAGLFGRDDALVARIKTASDASGEAVWHMPLHKNYAETMKSDIADIKNVSEGGRPGAGLAAYFLEYLTPKPTPWAHLDIAAKERVSKALPTVPKGTSGFGVRLFDALVRQYEVR